MDKQDLLSTLFLAKALAKYDGDVHRTEQVILNDLMVGFEISEEELAAYSHGRKLQETLERFTSEKNRDFLADILSLIACADGKLEEKEKKFIGEVFKRVGSSKKIETLLGPEGEQELIKIYNQIDELAYYYRQQSNAIQFDSGQAGIKLETDSCHVAFMDQQHSELLNKFGEYIGASELSTPKTKELLIFIKNYIVNHFSLEETQMVKWKYPKEEVHKKEHQLYVAAFEDLLNQYDSTNEPNSLKAGIIGMRDWFIKHINRFDHRMGFYFKTSLLAERQIKKVLIFGESEEEAKATRHGLEQMGLTDITVAFKERDLWNCFKLINVNLLVMHRSGTTFEDLSVANKIRQQIPGLPMLFLPTQENVAHFKETAWNLKLLGPKTQVSRFPYRWGELSGKLHDALYATASKPVVL
ncbi:MAG: hypothetical protein A2508_03350 [Candidatus Lambdaproteobacteria bacterium RIFOXYD12_FULL_49_8]|nr:MAG: hypothetical protein A2508_03350 [Candidatus Lambdaproteobacteria bacterium RIFOXYD12_FULL_49_8]